MSTELVMLVAAILALSFVGALVEPRRRGRARGRSRHARVSMRAKRRPASWQGPTPAELLDRIVTPDDLQRLKWWQFEHVVGEILRRLGYDHVVVLNSSGGDGGIDISAVWHGQPIVVQVKHLRKTEFAAIDGVRAFAFVIQRVGATAGYFVTTGQFSRTAVEEASRCRPPLHLVDNQALWLWVEQTRRPHKTSAAAPIAWPVPAGGAVGAAWPGLPALKFVGLAALVLVLGVCGLGALGAALAPRSGTQAPVSGTPVADARTAVKTYWDRNEQAWITGDTSILPQIYTGTGLDVATADMAAKRGDHPGKYARPFKAATLFVPAKSDSDQWFIASIQYVMVNQDGVGLGYGGPSVSALFVRDRGAWKVYARDFTPPGLPSSTSFFGGTIDHFVLPAPQAGGDFITDADTVPQQLIAYESALAKGQKPESLFPTTYGNYPEAAVKTSIYPGTQATVNSSFELSGRAFRYTGADGSQEVLFQVRRSVTAVPIKPGTCLFQPSNGGLYTVSDLVPPGNYAEISAVNTATVAISVPRRSSNAAVGRQLVGISGAGRDTSYQAVKGSCR